MNSFKVKKKILDVITHVILIAVALTCVFPVFWMLSSSLKTNEEIFKSITLFPEAWQWSNYTEALLKAKFGMYFLNSLIYTVVGVSAIVLVTSMAAYAFARLEFWGKTILFYLLISTLLIPIPGAFVPLYLLLKSLHLLDTRTGLLLCYISGGIAFGLFLLKAFFEELPREIEEAALIDGCSRFGIYSMFNNMERILVSFGCFARSFQNAYTKRFNGVPGNTYDGLPSFNGRSYNSNSSYSNNLSSYAKTYR